MRVTGSNITLGFDYAEVVERPRIFRKRGVPFVFQRAAFPIRINAAQYLLVFLGYRKSVAVTMLKFVQLRDHPIDGVFGKYRRGAIHARLISDYHCFRVYVNRHVAEHSVQHIRAFEDNLLLLAVTVAFRGEHGSLRADRGLNTE
jgi:hypothetical protein